MTIGMSRNECRRNGVRIEVVIQLHGLISINFTLEKKPTYRFTYVKVRRTRIVRSINSANVIELRVKLGEISVSKVGGHVCRTSAI